MCVREVKKWYLSLCRSQMDLGVFKFLLVMQEPVFEVTRVLLPNHEHCLLGQINSSKW